MTLMKVNAYFNHCNINVTNLEKSIEFYNKALGLIEERRKVAEDGSFILVYLTDGKTDFQLELTWLRDHPQRYELGENENHICFKVAGNYDEIRKYHKEMDCVCYENEKMGLYFIVDPDGYWLEILSIDRK